MSFDKVKQGLVDIGSAIDLVDTEIKKLIGNISNLGKEFDKSKGLSEMTANLAALNKVRKESDTLTKQQMDLMKSEEALKKEQIKTNNLIIASEEKNSALVKKTQQEEAKIAQQRQKAYEARKNNLIAEQKLNDQKRAGDQRQKTIEAETAAARQKATNARKQSLITEQKLIDAKRNAELREVKESERLAKAAERKLKQSAKLTSAYARQSKALTLLRNRAKDLAIRFGENSNVYKQAEKRVVALDNKLTKLDRRLGQGTRDVGKYSKALGGLKNVLGAAGVVGGFQLFFSVLKKGFTLVRQFQKENAVLAGVLGKTRKEIEPLTNDAKRLGATTAKTAKEVTSLQVAYARLGFTQEEIIDLTEDTIDGSIALGAALDETADLTGAVIRSFDDLTTTDADKVLDQLTLSTQKSALNFTKLQTAIPIAAGAASAAGVKFETMVSQLGQAADRGIDASTAATSLRNIYIQLADKGLTLEQALSKINNSQNKLTAATQLFGKRTAVTALALANTIDKTKSFEDALSNAGGTAKKVADEQLNTLDGQIQLLTSAWEGFILGLVKSEPLKNIVALLTQVVALSSSITQNQSLSESIIGDEETVKRIADTKDQINALKNELQGLKRETEEEALISQLTGDDSSGEIKRVNDEIAKLTVLLDDLKSGRIQITELTESIKIQQSEVDRLTSAFEKTGDPAYNKQIEDRLLIIEDLTAKLNSLTKTQTENNEVVNEEVVVSRDLIKEQEELLKLAKDMDGSTEPNIALRNRKIEGIEKEIARLKELGTAKAPEQIDTDVYNKAILDAEAELLEDQKALDDEEYEQFVKNEDKKTEALKEAEEERKELKQEAFEFGKEITNSLFENSLQNIQQETEEITANYDERLAVEGLSEEQRKLIEADKQRDLEEQAKKEKELQKKQFLFNQGLKLAEIAIDTSAAVIKATAASPLTFGQPFAGYAIITGAIQAAAVLAQTIPQFDKGTDSLPTGLKEVGERAPELVEHNGRLEFFDKPTILGNDYTGDKVYSSKETADILSGRRFDIDTNNVKDPQMLLVNKQILNKLDGIERASKKKHNIRIINSKGISSSVEKGNISMSNKFKGN